MATRQMRIGFCIVLGLSILLASREWMLAPDGRTHLLFLDVGQGDGALIVSPSGKQLVIDGGPDWSTLEGIARFMPFLDRSIDLVMLSHANLDHLVSLPEVLERYDIGALLVTDIPASLPQYGQMLAIAKKRNIPVRTLRAGDHIDLDDGLAVEILWPPSHPAPAFVRDLNNVAIVARITDGTHSALFTGDLEEIAELTLVRAKVDLRADILKVGHHGSKTSTSTGFLLAVKPSTAVISVGKENYFGHPKAGVIERIKGIGATVRRTDIEGTIEVVWD